MNSPVLHIGNRQLTAESIIQQLTKSQLLPQLLREIVTDEIIDQWQTSLDRALGYTQEEFEQAYQQVSQITPFQGMNRLQLEAITDRNLKLQKFKESAWGNRVTTYYFDRKQDLDQVVFYVMQVNDAMVAQELYFRVQEQEQPFSELAKEYSIGPNSQEGGKVGPIPLSSLQSAIAQKISSLKPNEVSALFSLDDSFLFVQLVQIIPAQFEQVRSRLLDELFEKWLQERISQEIGSITVSNNSNVIEPEFFQSESPLNVIGETPLLPEVAIIEQSTPTEILRETEDEISVSAVPVIDQQRINTSFFLPKQRVTELVNHVDQERSQKKTNRLIMGLMITAALVAGGVGSVYLFQTVTGTKVIQISP